MLTSRMFVLPLLVLAACAVEQPDAPPNGGGGGGGGKGDDGTASSCAGCDLFGICADDEQRDECKLDSDSRWQIFVVSAQIAADNDGAAWDPFSGAPDVYVRCERNNADAGVTDIESGTAPIWDTPLCEANGFELKENRVELRVYDDDTDELNPDDFIGYFSALLSLDDLTRGGDITQTLYLSPAFGGRPSNSLLTIRFERLD